MVKNAKASLIFMLLLTIVLIVLIHCCISYFDSQKTLSCSMSITNDQCSFAAQQVPLNAYQSLIAQHNALCLAHTYAHHHGRHTTPSLCPLLQAIKREWTKEEINNFIFELLTISKDDKYAQYKTLDLAFKEKIINPLEDFLYATASDRSSSSIEPLQALIGWLRQKKVSGLPSGKLYSNTIQECIIKILNQDDTSPLERLVSAGVTISHDYASELLSYVVEEEKSPAFVHFLIQLGGDPNSKKNIVAQSLLSQAISNNSYQMVQVLLESGATNIEGINEKELLSNIDQLSQYNSKNVSCNISKQVKDLLIAYQLIDQ